MAKTVGTSNLTEVWGSDRIAESAPALTAPTLSNQRKGFVTGVAVSNDATWAINVLGEKINHVLQNGVPTWNSETTYAVNNYTNHSGRIYRAVNATTNSTPSLVNANWEAVTLNGDLAGLGGSVGDIKLTAYATPDAGWALCNGQALSRTTYSALFAKIGTTYGVGDGSTTFNLPQTTDRFIQGAGAGRAVGTVQNESATVSIDGWGIQGGAFGSGVGGRLVVTSGAGEVGESLESLRSAALNGAATNVKPNNIAFHYMIKIV
jgi:hypothetical protein